MSVRDTIRAIKPVIAEYTLADGSKVWVRALSGPGRAAYTAYVEKAKANGGIKSEVTAAMGLCEQDGTLAYDWEKDEDVAELRDYLGTNGQDLDGVALKLFEISGIGTKADEEAAKN